MATTCDKCGCAYPIRWGSHYCLTDLPELPKDFAKPGKGGLPKADYHDRRAWLESVTGRISEDWPIAAKRYRAEAEMIARQALINAALDQQQA